MKEKIGLGAVVLLGLALRLYGLNWDSGSHLHPDERFLTMVADAIQFPPPGKWFDTATSTANPHNIGQRFYVYGTLPLFLYRAVAVALNRASYGDLALVQRALSAVADSLTVLLAALLAGALAPKEAARRAALVAASLYAFLPFALQTAHFGTVDALGTMLATLAVWLAMGRALPSASRALSTGAALGAAMACKPNLAAWAAVPAIAWTLVPATDPEDRRPAAIRLGAGSLALAGLAAFLVFRVAQPFAFAGPGVLDVALNPAWIENLNQLRALMAVDTWYPPGIQWIDRVFLLEPAKNLFVWATGPALGLAITVTSVVLLKRGLFGDRLAIRFLPILVPAGALLVWQATRPVASVRYAHPALPLLVAVAAAGLPLVFADRVRLATVLTAVTIVLTALSGLALLSIYTHETTRVTASRRLAELFPKGARVATEYWDDPLPIAAPGVDLALFPGESLPVFDPDKPGKAQRILESLARCDAVVLSSRRAVGTLARLPDAFPWTAEYYRLLFSGALGFEKAAVIEHPPALGPLRFDDRDAEEALSVYDHPVVTIFRKTPRFSPLLAASLLARVPDLPDPDPAPSAVRARGVAPDETPAERVRGVPSPSPPSRHGLTGNLLSLGAWLLALELLGVLGALLLRPLGAPAEVTGGLARPLGFVAAGLLWSWLGFLVPSFQLLAIPLFLAGLALSLAAAPGRRAFRDLGPSRVLFFALFALFLGLRALNPEVFWGEKPMDGAILGAALRTPVLPIPEPWFAGAPLDYYAHGVLPVALLARAANASAGLAYNLAAATLPALLGGAVFAAGFFLSRRRSGGVAALFLVLLSGTLAPLTNAGFRADPFGFNGFWSVSRVIPDAIDEFPLFTALFADLHAHFLGWAPFSALLVLALARIVVRPAASSPADRCGAVLLGLLAAAVHLTNPWETPVSALLVVAALLPARAGSRGSRRQRLSVFLDAALLAAGAALLAALPTLLHVRTTPVAFGLYRGAHALPLQYAELFGLPLALLAVAWVACPLAGREGRAAFALALLGVAVLVGAEVFYVADRMNTIFKLGLEARILLGLAAGATVPALLDAYRTRGVAFRALLALLAAAAGVVTFAGVANAVAVVGTRRVPGPRPALDGFAYVSAYDSEGAIRMDELNLRGGIPAILDPPGSPYSENLQTTMRTGCPTIVGWPWHLAQRRRSPAQVALRRTDVEWILSSPNAEFRARLLESYGIDPRDVAVKGAAR